MSVCEYIDIDKCKNWYILKVKTTKNKKNEDVQTIVKVTHLGEQSLEQVQKLQSYPVWERCIESGDYDHYFKLNQV